MPAPCSPRLRQLCFITLYPINTPSTLPWERWIWDLFSCLLIWLPWEYILSWLQTVASHCFGLLHVKNERSSVTPSWGQNPQDLPKTWCKISSHWGLGFEHMNLGGTHIQSIADTHVFFKHFFCGCFCDMCGPLQCGTQGISISCPVLRA